MFAGLRKRVHGLQERYVDCSTCPPERNCCANFSVDYGIVFSLYQAYSLFGEKVIEEMIREGRMVNTGRNGYRIVEGRCPALDDDNLCKVHSRKKELDLRTCISFPIALILGNVALLEKPSIQGPLLLVDYRCYGVRENWPHLNRELRQMPPNSVPIYVRHLLSLDDARLTTLGNFNKVRRKKRLPEQGF